MSNMIDRLSAMSREVGANASASLATRGVLDSMEARIERGVRRRRRQATTVVAITVLVAGVGAVVAPRVWGDIDAPTVPGTEAEIVQSTGALTVLSDGSMSVVTSRGEIIDIPPVAPDDYQPFSSFDNDAMCEGPDLDHFPLGWEYHQESARELLTFGRPLFLFDSGPQLLAQGSTHYASSPTDHPALGFQLEADPAIAEHVVLRSAIWMVGDVGAVAQGTRLIAVPTATIEGGDGAARPVALISTGPVVSTGYCFPKRIEYSDASYYQRYLQVDVFITDHAGNAVLIATHRSWSALDFSQIEEAPKLP
jgi:hypothetical protein